MKLEDLKVNSFITSLNNNETKTIKGQFDPRNLHTAKDDCSHHTVKYNDCISEEASYPNICITGQPCPYASDNECRTLDFGCA